MNIQHCHPVRQGSAPARRARGGLFDAAEGFSSRRAELFQNDTLWPYFERLRNEEPVHYCTNAPIEPYWSVTKYNDIMHVDTNHGVFSSDVRNGGIVDPRRAARLRLAELHRDGPAAAQRAAQDRVADVHADHLDELAVLIRQRSAKVLDALPRNETFNFVERVSIELTTQMLATLFDFPWEDRAQADALVRCFHRAAEKRRGLVAGGAPARDGRMRGLFHQDSGTSASIPSRATTCCR